MAYPIVAPLTARGYQRDRQGAYVRQIGDVSVKITVHRREEIDPETRERYRVVMGYNFTCYRGWHIDKPYQRPRESQGISVRSQAYGNGETPEEVVARAEAAAHFMNSLTALAPVAS